MGRDRRRIVTIALVLVALQAAAVGVYLAVQRGRSETAVTPFRVEPLASGRIGFAPDILLERADGTRLSLHEFDGQIRLVHFWATWCPPCLEELPGLLATSRDLSGRGLTLVAVSLDADWAEVRSFFAGTVPPEIYRAVNPKAHVSYDIASLPDTFLVSAEGRRLFRYGGARDWQSPSARSHLADQL